MGWLLLCSLATCSGTSANEWVLLLWSVRCLGGLRRKGPPLQRAGLEEGAVRQASMEEIASGMFGKIGAIFQVENVGRSIRQKARQEHWECEVSSCARVGDEAGKLGRGQFSGILGVSQRKLREAQELERLPCSLMGQVLFLR